MSNAQTTKTCSRCGQAKPLEDFSRQKQGKYGRTSECKSCRSAYNRELRQRWRAEVQAVDTKVCSGCDRDLPLSEYYKGDGRFGTQARCKTCIKVYRAARYAADPEKHKQQARAWVEANPERVRRSARGSRLLAKYGVSLEQYEEMLAAQDGKCAICRTTDPGVVRGGQTDIFRVDHCHTTGKVRGLLCNECNKGIGTLGDSPDRLMAAAAYLLQHQDLLAVAVAA